jgi:serine/threonine protein phosphatase PrpC
VFRLEILHRAKAHFQTTTTFSINHYFNTMIVELSALTNEGRVRTNNEDSWDIIAPNWNTRNNSIHINGNNSGNGILLAIADGMGGTNAGEIASKIAIETFRREFLSLAAPVTTSKWRILEGFLKKAHQNILAEAMRNLNYTGMGTTAVLAWLIDDTAYVAWCGDSRCYLHREGKPFDPITDDHSMVWEEVKKGNMTAEQARLSDDSNIILQSLGDASKLPKPESKVVPLQKGDRILLCTDGLNGMLSDIEMEKIIHSTETTHDTLSAQLIEAANAAGGRDNITVIAAKIMQGKPLAAEAHQPQLIAETASTPVNKTANSALLLVTTGLLSLSMIVGYMAFKPVAKVQAAFSDTEIQLVGKLNQSLALYNTDRKKLLNITDKVIGCGFEKEIVDVNLKHNAMGELLYPFGLDFNVDKSAFVANKASKTKEINDKVLAMTDSLLTVSKKGVWNLMEQYRKTCGAKDALRAKTIGTKKN